MIFKQIDTSIAFFVFTGAMSAVVAVFQIEVYLALFRLYPVCQRRPISAAGSTVDRVITLDSLHRPHYLPGTSLNQDTTDRNRNSILQSNIGANNKLPPKSTEYKVICGENP